jgi:hypothetical protein
MLRFFDLENKASSSVLDAELQRLALLDHRDMRGGFYVMPGAFHAVVWSVDGCENVEVVRRHSNENLNETTHFA